MATGKKYAGIPWRLILLLMGIAIVVLIGYNNYSARTYNEKVDEFIAADCSGIIKTTETHGKKITIWVQRDSLLTKESFVLGTFMTNFIHPGDSVSKSPGSQMLNIYTRKGAGYAFNLQVDVSAKLTTIF